MDEPIIRPAEIKDLDTLLAFEQAMIEAERPFDDTIRTGAHVRYYDLEELITSPEAEVVVAEIGSEIIGSGYAKIETSDPYLKHSKHSYLGFMYVVEQHRGKGVNRKILDALEIWSLSKGVTELKLEVYVDNASARKAYEKSGYNNLILTMRKELGGAPGFDDDR